MLEVLPAQVAAAGESVHVAVHVKQRHRLQVFPECPDVRRALRREHPELLLEPSADEALERLEPGRVPSPSDVLEDAVVRRTLAADDPRVPVVDQQVHRVRDGAVDESYVRRCGRWLARPQHQLNLEALDDLVR